MTRTYTKSEDEKLMLRIMKLIYASMYVRKYIYPDHTQD